MKQSDELHPARLFRAAQGNRPEEAAIVLLAEHQLIGQLHSCLTVDTTHQHAWIDWHAATTIAQRLPHHQRAAIVLAATIALEGPHLLPHAKPTLRLAFEHLLA